MAFQYRAVLRSFL